MRTRSKNTLLAVFIALLLHALFLLILWHLPKAQPVFKDVSEPQKIQVHLKQDNSFKKQVVQISPPKEDRILRKADYLSEFNNRVDKETQAANKSPTPPPKPVAPSPPPLAKGAGPKRNLLPTWQDLERMQPTSPTAFNDNLGKTETGTQTQLNTFEWKHAAYFNRIKETVARIWSPILQIRRYDPAGALIGKSERTTLVEITLDLSGAVINAQLKSPSGVFYLDDEAIQAFKKAAQFPNPPKALFAEKDNFSFTFGFVVSLQKGFSMSFD
jgi:protein TonB